MSWDIATSVLFATGEEGGLVSPPLRSGGGGSAKSLTEGACRDGSV